MTVSTSDTFIKVRGGSTHSRNKLR